MKFLGSNRFDYSTSTFNPGPGHYDAPDKTKQNRSIPRSRKPVITTAFGQGAERFQEIVTSDINIGPGQYFGVGEWSTKQKREHKTQIAQNTRKIVTIPSIPASTHAMGYVEREDGYLVPLNGATIKEHEDMGPGVYNPTDNLTKKKILGFSLDKNTSERFPKPKEELKVVKPPPPELYDLPKDIITDREKLARKKREHKKVETLENKQQLEKLGEELPLPPGMYYNEKLASSFKVQYKPPEYQNFGSTSKRFVSIREKANLPGPGAYDNHNIDTSNAVYLFRQEPFSKGDTRFKSAGTVQPGPGVYDPNFNFTPASASTNAYSNFSAAFGSGAGRFVTPKLDADAPGPGTYEGPKSKKKKKKVGGKLAVPPQYHSASSIENNKGKTMDLDLGGRTKGAVTVKFEVLQNGTSSFNPHIKRFKDDNIKEENLGPGTYHLDPKSSMLKPSFRAIKENFAMAPRGQLDKSQAYKSLISPGMYDYNVEFAKPKVNYAPKINPVPLTDDVNLLKC